MAVAVGRFQPDTRAQKAGVGLSGGLENIADDAVLVELVIARYVVGEIDAINLYAIGRCASSQRCSSAVTGRIGTGQSVVFIVIGVEGIVCFPTIAPSRLQPCVFEIGLFADAVVIEITLAGRVIVHAVAFTEFGSLRQRRAGSVVRDIGRHIVVARKQGQHRIVSDRALELQHEVIAFDLVVGQITVAGQMLVIQLDGRVTVVFQTATFVRHARQAGIPIAKRGVRTEFPLLRWHLGKQVDAAAIGRLTQVAGITGTPLDDYATQHRGRKVGRRMMGRVVGIAKGNCVECDVVLAVGESTQGRFGVA